MLSSPSVLDLIQAVDAADSANALVDAVTALSAARDEAALPTLIAALGYNNPGAAVAAVDGLVQLGDRAVQPLLELLDAYNYGARAWAVRALAGIGHPDGLDILLESASSDFALSVRRAAARGLGTIQWHKLAADQRLEAQLKATAVLTPLLQTDPEWVVRYAAIAGLESLALTLSAHQPHHSAAILTTCVAQISIDPDLTVRTRLQLAQMHIQQHRVPQ